LISNWVLACGAQRFPLSRLLWLCFLVSIGVLALGVVIFVWPRGYRLDCYCRDGVCVGRAVLMIFGVRAPI
jgi:hypothetical protein